MTEKISSTVKVLSYLRVADGSFSSLEDVKSAPRDPLCVEGAIDLIVDDKRLIDMSMWDYVDQLWAYISDMMLEFPNNDEVSTYFPDQPIKLSFRKVDAEAVMIVVELNGEIRTAVAPRAELFDALREQGMAFFEKMIDLMPSNRGSYEESLLRLGRG